MSKIIFIPDVQAKPNVPLDHLTWAGLRCAEKKPDAIVCAGDFADMESLSSYDVGKKSFEGRRYTTDIEVAKDAMSMFMKPILQEQDRLKKNKDKRWKPNLIMLLGNHENRINRAIENDAKLEGLIKLSDLGYESFGWEVYPYLQVVPYEGIAFSHYFVSGILGRPITTARQLLIKHHMSCIAGHQQGRDIAYGQSADGRSMTSIISGCLTPDHRVLTAGLEYAPLGDLKEGDTLVSFSEQPTKRRRRFETGVLERVARDIDDVWEVTLASGKSFKVTKDHQWLAKTGSMYFWRTTASLQIGTQIPKLIDEWTTLNTYDAGWLAGIFKPEYMGNIACSDNRNDRVVSKKYLGKLEIVRSKVDKGTYISEGYGHHNSFYQHEESYLTAQTNIHWRGIWQLNEVHNGSFDELPLSLDYLRRTYA